MDGRRGAVVLTLPAPLIASCKSQTQKSPQGFHLAGSQDFDDGSGNHQPRILVGWRNLNKNRKLMYLDVFI